MITQTLSREAARAVIMQNNAVALIKSEASGFYKFPGGGVEEGETHIDALVRETLEETGLTIIRHSISELGCSYFMWKLSPYTVQILHLEETLLEKESGGFDVVFKTAAWLYSFIQS